MIVDRSGSGQAHQGRFDIIHKDVLNSRKNDIKRNVVNLLLYICFGAFSTISHIHVV